MAARSSLRTAVLTTIGSLQRKGWLAAADAGHCLAGHGDRRRDAGLRTGGDGLRGRCARAATTDEPRRASRSDYSLALASVILMLLNAGLAPAGWQT